MSDRVTIAIEGGVADVRLNRPEKLNALDRAMFDALVDAGDSLRADPSVRAVVLSGNGRGFCAGLDVANFGAMAAGPSGDGGTDDGAGATRSLGDRDRGRITNVAQQAVYTWTELPVPVIAAVHGVALGGGIQIALGADLRLVAADARLSVLEIRWGLLPDMTGLQMLPRLVGLDVAKELAFTGRMVSGEEAVALGLATRVCERPLEDALFLAHEIAGKNPKAIRGTKALLNAAGSRPLAESFLEESRLMGELIGSPNQVEAVKAFFDKRAAVFTDD
ncbi:MAG: crotonase/enoyl-CoA hydratase family protein [Actinomycetota bacterium]|nr:crotonase/enoyl-CoA hydratase family protein [Actinomycetota bacterium]